MTNLKKSYGIPVLAFLALAFCVLLIGQTAIAKSEGKLTLEAIPIYDGVGVPLPGTDDVAVTTRAPKKEAHSVQQPVALSAAEEGALPVVGRTDRPDLVASVLQGGDTYGTATIITGPFPWQTPGVFAGTTVGYNHDYDATLCGSANLCPDVVYTYTPPADVFLDISLCTSGGTDTKLWVLEAATVTEIQCNDDGDDCPGYESHIPAFAVTGSTEYYIVIGGWGDNDAGPYEMVLSEYTEGADCEAPIPIEFDPGDGEDDDSQDWVVAVADGGLGVSTITAEPTMQSLFMEFTAEKAGLFTFTFTTDGVVPVIWLVGIAGAIQCPYAYALAYGGDHGSFTLQGVMMPGWTYEVELFAIEDQTGTLTISREVMQAFNDECVDAEDLGAGDGYHFIHNVNATLSDGPDFTFCDNAQVPYSMTCGDVWYYWEADTDGYVNFDMCLYGESWDSKMFVYRGYSCNGAETIDPFGCSDDGCGFFGDGGFIEMPCSVGEVFMIRVAGWISGENEEDASCAAEGGMGTGYMDIYQHATSWRPANDDCPDAVVGVLGPGADVYTSVSNLVMSGWGSCPDLYNVPDGSIGPGGAFVWMIFDAFSISECTDVRIDFCGTYNGDGRYIYTNWPEGINIFTGCPCEGPFVTIPASGGTYSGVCDPGLYPDPDFGTPNRAWDYNGLIPGTFYAPTSHWHMGMIDNNADGTYTAPYDITVNFRGTPVECVYCDAWTNLNTCPDLEADPPVEVGNATWIKDVNLGDIDKDGVPYVQHVSNDCNSYEDHTDMIAHLYRGISYDFDMVFDKTGDLSDLDICDVWADWNQNSGLCANQTELDERYTAEQFISGSSPNYIFHFVVDITPPMDAMGPLEGATEYTLLRVRLASTADGVNTPCGERLWGEVEDFVIEVSDIECGDFDLSGTLDAADIEFLRDWYFGGTTAPDFWQRADIDGDGVITIADVIALVDAAYHGGDLICL